MNEKILSQSKLRKWSKRAGLTALLGATLLGTYSGRHPSDGGMVPLWVRKTGTSYGICLAGKVELEKSAKHYGVIIAPRVKSDGDIVGGCLSFISSGMNTNNSAGSIYGISVAIAGQGDIKEVRGVQASILVNNCENLAGAQIGLFNQTSRGPYTNRLYQKLGFILNFDNEIYKNKEEASK